MGEHKALLPFAGETVLERMARAFREGGVRDVVTVVEQFENAISRKAAEIEVRSIVNDQMDLGMAGSILAAIADCASDWFAVCPADMPLLTAETVRMCVERLNGEPVAPSVNGKRKHPVFIPATCSGELARLLLGGGTLRDFLASRAVLLVECEPGVQFADMDTPEEYRRLLDLLEG
jgi:CTP:molybdopterin cytidylyltransferase MocA